MVKTRSTAPEEQDFTISSLPPGPAQRRFALGVVLVLIAAFVLTAPLASVPLARIDAFIPMYVAAMVVNHSITGVLLFAHFAILRSNALLAISSGYLFSALIVIPWMLMLPGLFAPGGLLGAGLQSTAWLYFLGHVGFLLFVIAYALLKNADPSKQRWKGARSAAILLSAAVVIAAVCAATLLVTAGHALLPSLMRDAVSTTGSFHQYVAAYILVAGAGVAIIVRWVRWRSVLDLWLMVVLCAHVIEVCLVLLSVNRYTFGWYAARIFGLISASLVLFVLLYEITTLYARLVDAVLAQRREREARLMTGDAVSASIAHEVNQPLSAIIANADAGLNWLTRAVPDLEEAKAALTGVTSEIHTSGGVMVLVKDTGTGVAPEDVDRIFTPLFTTKRHGMGMGLSISRSIIEAHNGRLWSVPNVPRGSVFQFILPADPGMAPRRQAARHATDAAARSVG